MSNCIYSYPNEEDKVVFSSLEDLLEIDRIKKYSLNPYPNQVFGRYAIHNTFEVDEWFPPYDWMLMVEGTRAEDGTTWWYPIGRLEHNIPELPRAHYDDWVKMWAKRKNLEGVVVRSSAKKKKRTMSEDQQIRIAVLPFAIEFSRGIGHSLHDCDETDTCVPSQVKFDTYVKPWIDILAKSIKND